VWLGFDDIDPKKRVYKECFERPFINATEKYYKQETETLLVSHPISAYLKKGEQRLFV